MSYLRFEKTFMTNLDETLTREILRTNRSGAYHCTTIVDCNTRKYHGLLVVPVPELDDENHVLISSLDATVIQHGAEFNLGVHQYWGGNFSPRGHKYIRTYDCDKVPTTIYRVGGVVLKKEKLLEHHENRVLIRYTLMEAHSETTLRLRPYLAFRSVRQFTHQNGQADLGYALVENGIRTCMYSGYPDLYMQLSKENKFVFKPDWYRGFEYFKERERGYDANEDLYVPGYFEFTIKKGESVVFAAGTKEARVPQLRRIFASEAGARTPRDNFYHCLKNSAHQFHNKQDRAHYILAGYPWFKCRARDMFVALPGLTLAIGENFEFESAMATAERAIMDFIKGRPRKYQIYELEKPDVLLWAIWAVQQYVKFVSVDKAKASYGKLVNDIIEFVRKNRHQNMFVRPNGLISINGKDSAETWMNSTCNGVPVIPRTGYVVEINALWYNALCFAAELNRHEGDSKHADKLSAMAFTVGQSFLKTFVNQYGYLYDFVDEDTPDWSVRPNMIIAAALDYSPLDVRQKKSIVDYCTRELLTPKGLRSLSPVSPGYNPYYVGPQRERDLAYHQGTAWPWLMGFYFEAYLKVFRRSGLSFVERQLIGYEEEMTSHCVGSIPELFDGNPPFKGRGAVSFAMNVAELLRTIRRLNEFE